MKRCVIALHCCLLSACMPWQGTAESGVAVFNGDWQALMRDTQAVQRVRDLRFDCAPFQEPFFLRVRDGAIAGYLQSDENFSFSTPIDSKGRFRALIPTNSAYTYKEVQASRESSIVLVLQGRLSERARPAALVTGQFVVGDSALDGQGCTTSVQFVPI